MISLTLSTPFQSITLPQTLYLHSACSVLCVLASDIGSSGLQQRKSCPLNISHQHLNKEPFISLGSISTDRFFFPVSGVNLFCSLEKKVPSEYKFLGGGKTTSSFSAESDMLGAELEFSFHLLTSVKKLSAHSTDP